ncbi:hypothetical protein VTN96DRAFT_6609 [Rasamsonia emersonii]
MVLLRSTDRQKATWEKLTVDLTNKIVRVNAPRTINECWFIHGSETDTARYPVNKLSSRGEANKWPLHRILFFLSSPGSLAGAAGQQVAHLCGQARYDFSRGINISCINPYHLVQVAHQVNLDHNLCRRSCAAW